jgi:hypothetical protein
MHSVRYQTKPAFPSAKSCRGWLSLTLTRHVCASSPLPDAAENGYATEGFRHQGANEEHHARTET